jgi:hypothetical protein
MPKELIVKLRYPKWAESGIELLINGKKQKIEQKPGSFIMINRKWKSGDRLVYKMPFTLRLETMPDDTNRVAVMYGPLVLAGELGDEKDPHAYDPMYVPVIMTEDRNPADWLDEVDGDKNTFKTVEVGTPREFTLLPFYKTHEVRYSVYFDIFNNESWEKYQVEYKAELEKKKELEAKTIDFFQPGEMQPERNHNFKSKKSTVELLKNRKARSVERGGIMSFEMELKRGNKAALVVEYWGGYTGSKTFDILIDKEYLATQNITQMKPGKFVYVQYDLPDKVFMNKNKITVTFYPHEGHRAGPVFGVRTIRLQKITYKH